MDIVWDVYLPESLKADTRRKRGRGVRRRVEAASAIPSNWKEFLRIDDNKTELFAFLGQNIADISTSKQIITTHHRDVICTNHQDVSGLAPCTHEEADTRMLLHVEHAVHCGFNEVSIHTVDTDLVVLAISLAQRLDISELWIAFGTGKNFRLLAAHSQSIGSRSMCWLANVPRIHWLRYGVFFWRKREENCMGNLEDV